MITSLLTNTKLLIASALLLVVGATAAMSTMTVSAQDAQQQACEAIGQTWNGSECGSGEAELNNTITNIINIFSIVVGILAVIMIIYGGFQYVTSGGDSGKITSAKHTIMYAIIGIIVAALAQIIVRFVLGQTV